MATRFSTAHCHPGRSIAARLPAARPSEQPRSRRCAYRWLARRMRWKSPGPPGATPARSRTSRTSPTTTTRRNRRWSPSTVPIPTDGYDAKLLTQLNGGTAPDLFYVGDGDVSTLIKNQVVMDLTELLSSDDQQVEAGAIRRRPLGAVANGRWQVLRRAGGLQPAGASGTTRRCSRKPGSPKCRPICTRRAPGPGTPSRRCSTPSRRPARPRFMLGGLVGAPLQLGHQQRRHHLRRRPVRRQRGSRNRWRRSNGSPITSRPRRSSSPAACPRARATTRCSCPASSASSRSGAGACRSSARTRTSIATSFPTRPIPGTRSSPPAWRWPTG